MKLEYLKDLWDRYQKDMLSQHEMVILKRLLVKLPEEDLEALIDSTIIVDYNAKFPKENVYQTILKKLSLKSKRERIRNIAILSSAAAAVILLVLIGTWKITDHFGRENKVVGFYKKQKNDITLLSNSHPNFRLLDGKILPITRNVRNLRIGSIGIKSHGGENYSIIVDPTEENKEMYFAFENAKGKTSHLILSDGSEVWLNSASKLEISNFYGLGKNRNVKLIGEAYFEVKHDANRPFFVNSKDVEIKVLGTTFNIKSRTGNGGVEATLVTGKIFVRNKNRELILLPNQQANIQDPIITLNKDIDIGSVLAWKNGSFNFENKPIPEILEELKEWYDLDQIILKTHSKERITLNIVRTRSLKELLDKMELISNLKFKIEGRRLIVQ